jgi:hypothetical protein
MSELISGKEALIALANGEDVQLRNLKDNWYKEWTDYNSFKFKTWIGFFIEGESSGYEFRLKPRTIKINGTELNQCYSVAIDYTELKVSVEFKNRNDAEALHDVISKLYGFK